MIAMWSGAFWGHLFAHLILLPLSRAGVPADPATVTSTDDTSMTHLGLAPGPLGALRAAITAGTVTILVLHDDSDDAALVDAFAPRALFSARVELTDAEEHRLYAGFGEVSVGAAYRLPG